MLDALALKQCNNLFPYPQFKILLHIKCKFRSARVVTFLLGRLVPSDNINKSTIIIEILKKIF